MSEKQNTPYSKEYIEKMLSGDDDDVVKTTKMSHIEHGRLKPVDYSLHRKTLRDGLRRLMEDEDLTRAIYNRSENYEISEKTEDRLDPYPFEDQILSKFVIEPGAFDAFVLNFAVSLVVISITKQRNEGFQR